jgi:hypothetical protein
MRRVFWSRRASHARGATGGVRSDLIVFAIETSRPFDGPGCGSREASRPIEIHSVSSVIPRMSVSYGVRYNAPPMNKSLPRLKHDGNPGFCG